MPLIAARLRADARVSLCWHADYLFSAMLKMFSPALPALRASALRADARYAARDTRRVD